jgi:hypothetical protein
LGYWSNGVMEYWKDKNLLFPHHSTTPVLQYSRLVPGYLEVEKYEIRDRQENATKKREKEPDQESILLLIYYFPVFQNTAEKTTSILIAT